MKNLSTLGKYIFAIPFGIFGLMHFMNASQFAGMVPSFVPGGIFWVYLTGAALLAAAVSFVVNKYVYLAGLLLSALLMVFVLTVHLPAIIGGNMMAMGGLLKDMSLIGGSLMVVSIFGEQSA